MHVWYVPSGDEKSEGRRICKLVYVKTSRRPLPKPQRQCVWLVDMEDVNLARCVCASFGGMIGIGNGARAICWRAHSEASDLLVNWYVSQILACRTKEYCTRSSDGK